MALFWDIVLRKLIYGLFEFRGPIFLLGYIREAIRFIIS